MSEQMRLFAANRPRGRGIINKAIEQAYQMADLEDLLADRRPLNFPEWLEFLEANTNKAAIIFLMIRQLFPEDQEDYRPSYLNQVAKRCGGFRRLAQLLWIASAHRPTGNVVTYALAMTNGFSQDDRYRSRAGQTAEITML